MWLSCFQQTPISEPALCEIRLSFKQTTQAIYSLYQHRC